MHDLTAFQRDLLYVTIGLEEPHGIAIKDELENYYETEISHGRLYPNFDTLVEKQDLNARSNVYTVTRRRQREIEARTNWTAQYVE